MVRHPYYRAFLATFIVLVATLVVCVMLWMQLREAKLADSERNEMCEADAAQCRVLLSACADDKEGMQGSLSSCRNDLATCTLELALCRNDGVPIVNTTPLR